MENYEIVYLSQLIVGDTVEYLGTIMTVNKQYLDHGGFSGTTFMGDSYNCNTKKIKRILYGTSKKT